MIPEKKIELYRWQKNVLDAFKKFRYVVLSIGRQSGKTFICLLITMMKANANPNWIIWWVAPIYMNSQMAFRRMRELLEFAGIPHTENKTNLYIKLGNGTHIFFKSGDKEHGLRGETVNFLVIDEMGLIKRDTWLYALRGTISATGAQVLFSGTPKGKNVFYELFLKGQDPQETKYTSFQHSSKISPHVTDEEWAEIMKLPRRVIEQEFLAMFVDDGGEVFRNVKACIRGSFEPKMNKGYYAGIDLAKSHDYTVIIIMDEKGHVVYFDRFNDISWTVQKQRIIDACARYDAYTLIDSTGLGDPILDDLSGHMPVDGFKFSNTSKRQLIEALAMSIERADVSYPEIPELINELNTFAFEQGSSGVIKYNAPEGLHDDCVIALALANWSCGRNRGGFDSIGDIGERTFKGGDRQFLPESDIEVW